MSGLSVSTCWIWRIVTGRSPSSLSWGRGQSSRSTHSAPHGVHGRTLRRSAPASPPAPPMPSKKPPPWDALWSSAQSQCQRRLQAMGSIDLQLMSAGQVGVVLGLRSVVWCGAVWWVGVVAGARRGTVAAARNETRQYIVACATRAASMVGRGWALAHATRIRDSAAAGGRRAHRGAHVYNESLRRSVCPAWRGCDARRWRSAGARPGTARGAGREACARRGVCLEHAPGERMVA